MSFTIIEIMLFTSIGLMSLMIGVILTNRLFGPSLENLDITIDFPPLVSILIPARNEEDVILRCVESLANQRYPRFEVVVLDDRSSDATGQIVKNLSAKYSHVRLIEGKDLPDDWTGKNWACYQLAQNALGEILIFTDADTWHHPDAVHNTVSAMLKYKLHLLSAFPKQEMKSPYEKLLIPSIDMLAYSMLVLWATLSVPFPSVAAANGQWIAITKDAYRTSGGHALVKREIVEDVYLARRLKQAGYRTLAVSGVNRIFCRMYRNTAALKEGIRKSIMGIFGYRTGIAFLAVTVFLVSMILPYFILVMSGFHYLSIIAVGLNLLYRTLLVIFYHHPPVTIFLHPVSVGLFIFQIFQSYRQLRKGYFYWKGRKITID